MPWDEDWIPPRENPYQISIRDLMSLLFGMAAQQQQSTAPTTFSDHNPFAPAMPQQGQLPPRNHLLEAMMGGGNAPGAGAGGGASVPGGAVPSGPAGGATPQPGSVAGMPAVGAYGSGVSPWVAAAWGGAAPTPGAAGQPPPGWQNANLPGPGEGGAWRAGGWGNISNAGENTNIGQLSDEDRQWAEEHPQGYGAGAGPNAWP